MGKRRPNDAGLEDQDPYAARMNAGASFSLGSTSGFGGGGAAGAVAGEGASRGMLFVHHLRALNDQFAVWVKQRVAEHPLEPMTSGVIDYLAHLKQVEETFQDAMRAALDQPNGGGSSTGLSTSMASRLQPAAAAAPIALAPKPAALSFTLPASLTATASASSAPAAAAPATFTAAAAASPAPLFPNLGAAPATSPAPSPFAFGGDISSAPAFGAPPTTTTAAAAAPKALSFNLPSNTNPFAAGGGLSVAVPPPAAAEVGGEDGEEPPPSPTKVERSQESEAEDDILYEGKAKLFIKKTGPEWRDMGLGTLTLRKKKSGGGKAYIVLTNNVGSKHLLNASLYEGLKIQTSPGEKGGRQLVMMLYNTTSASEGKVAEMHMLRFGKVETATAFRLVVEANVPAKA